MLRTAHSARPTPDGLMKMATSSLPHTTCPAWHLRRLRNLALSGLLGLGLLALGQAQTLGGGGGGGGGGIGGIGGLSPGGAGQGVGSFGDGSGGAGAGQGSGQGQQGAGTQGNLGRGGQQQGNSGTANNGALNNNSTLTNQDGSNSADGADSNNNGSDTDLGAGTLRTRAVQNEFQRFVQASTGQQLPLFGTRYFSGSPRVFAPSNKGPAPADYVLGPGDELQIRAWGSIDVDFRAEINRNGQISLPKIGTFGLAGAKFSDAETILRAQIGRIYKNFSLNVTMGRLRSVQIFVVGQARQPGNFTVSSLSTLINVIFASGGPGPNGSMRRIQLKRDGRVITELDLYDFIVKGNKDADVRIQPDDTLVYLPTGPQVAILGSLDLPAVYELKGPTESISQLLSYGGGTHASTNAQTALLERIDASNTKAPRTVNAIDLTAAATATLRDGDILTLFGVAPQFANAVTLRGNVAAPLRYPFTPGMRVSQLIPDREALITPDYYLRKNKLVQFIETRDVSENKLDRDIRNLVDEPNWEYAAVERLNADRITTELIPFNLGKAVIDHDPAHDIQLKPGDVVTIFARADIRNPVSRQTRLVRVQGEVQAPGIYPVSSKETLQQIIQRAGGITPEAYVFGIEFTREETRKLQQLALDDAVKRLESQLASDSATSTANLTTTDVQAASQLRVAQIESRKAQLSRLKSLRSSGRISLELPTTVRTLTDLPDLSLEDGDRITVPPKPAFVFTIGAVSNNNALLWKPGKLMKDYLDLAGVDVEADLENTFIVRADGTVLHASRRGWFFDSLEKETLMPGDSVVVPERGNRETFWTGFTRGLKDWSQILYQFGLSAAAIKTLRN
jgi:protein involved in polysaccharide export with SLBB domain